MVGRGWGLRLALAALLLVLQVLRAPRRVSAIAQLHGPGCSGGAEAVGL